MKPTFKDINQPGWEISPVFLRQTLMTLVAGMLVYIVVLRWAVPEQTWRVLGPLAALALLALAWRVMHTHGINAAKRVLGMGAWALMLVVCTFNGGVLTPITIGFPVVLLMIGWLFAERVVIWVGGITAVAIMGMVVGDAMAWLPTPPRTPAAMYGVLQALMVVLTVYIVLFMVRSYRGRLGQIGTIADHLSHQTTELEVSQRRLQTVIDVSGMVFWEYHLAQDRLTYDTSRLGLLNLDPQQAPADVRGWLQLVHPEDARQFSELFRRTGRQTAPAIDHDYRIQSVDGDWLWVHMRGAIVQRDANGLPEVMGGGIVSIEARKQAEAALTASEREAHHLAQMLRSLCDNAPDMIWAKDLNGHYLFANKAICEQLLCATDTTEPEGKSDLFFAHRQRQLQPQNATWHTFGELCQNTDAATLAQGTPARFEEFGNVRGKHLVLDVHKAPFVNAAGEVVGVVGTGRDITAHQAALNRLRLLAMAVDRSSEALMITDAHNRVVEINPAFTRLTGYDRADMLGQTPALLHSGQHGAEFYRNMWASLVAEGEWQGEIWNRRKDGEVIVEWLTINTLYDDAGLPHRRVALFSDVTESKRREESLWRQANFDPLTQLPNRRLFNDRLAVDVRKAKRNDTRLAVLYLDLDHFKEVNDTRGHEWGDRLLVQSAKRLLACVRDADTVARLGGDEFTIILPDIESAADASQVAEKIVHSLGLPFDLGGQHCQVSASIGMAIWPDDATEPEKLVMLADQAMYEAKRAGRNGYRFSTAAGL